MQKNKGFTLIELMVTIAVLGIIATIAAPSFSEMMKSYKLIQTKKQIMQALNEGRSRAAASRAPVVVCPGKINGLTTMTADQCLIDAGVSSTGLEPYKDSNRVILINVKDSVKVNGDTMLIFGQTGASLDSIVSGVPKARKITVCSDKKSVEIVITLLGNIAVNSSGACV
ncbi:Tfp pilus assembly protein FimT/FimU [Acinetobacter sp. YH01021]|uniref:pilus assembly FimT family protein n=1 Tax=Acinetobacter sp. YH01021 TaxID=2601035 RepID=UPI0015D2E39D|nr:prepilin-type N-terminal cleavage/methylation domain-containing protein [Acinetobacter sp. YH01021]